MSDAVGHYTPRAFEEPWTFEELVLRFHGTSPCELFAIQLVRQSGNRGHREES